MLEAWFGDAGIVVAEPRGSDSDFLTASAVTDVARLGGAIAARVRQALWLLDNT